MSIDAVKQKSYWPYAIFSSFIMLAAFDAYIVTRAIQTSTATITTRPYEEGLLYENTIKARQAALNAGIKMKVKYDQENVSFGFINLDNAPKVLKLRLIKPDNAGFDRLMELKSSGNEFVFKRESLQPGLWFIEATLKYERENSTEYFFEAKEIIE